MKLKDRENKILFLWGRSTPVKTLKSTRWVWRIDAVLRSPPFGLPVQGFTNLNRRFQVEKDDDNKKSLKGNRVGTLQLCLYPDRGRANEVTKETSKKKNGRNRDVTT